MIIIIKNILFLSKFKKLFMKVSIITVILLVSTLFIGCKKEKSIDNLEEVKSQKIENNFKVTLNVVLKKDDHFSLYYSEDKTLNFNSEALWSEVKGNENPQDVIFTLPEDVYPTDLRLDFGMNKQQDDIYLKMVTFEYKGIKKQIIGADIVNYFIPDQSKCTFDSTGLIKAVVKDGNRQFPSLYPQVLNLEPLLENFGKQ